MISIVVVTYNRKTLLEDCLKSILTQNVSKEYEIFVIDNCSNDGTEDLIRQSFNGRTIFIKNTMKLNISICKSLAIKYASGDIIAFIDDDCLASENWLNTIESSINNYDFIGGPVLPISYKVFPWWWRNSLNWLIGINLKPNKKFLPLGSNVAFKKDVLKILEEDMHLISLRKDFYFPYFEDKYRVEKALKRGFSMKLDQDMIVYHYVPKQRFNTAYLIKRSFNEGKAWVFWESNIKTFSFCLVNLVVNFFKLVVFWDINRFFRLIVDTSYILHYFKNNFID